MVSRSRSSSASSTSNASQTFEDALENHDELRFSPEEEAKLVDESNSIKADANHQFARGDYSQAIGTYDRALASCPNYLEYEIAVLRSNIAACHVKLEDWKTAVKSATDGLEALDRAEGKPKASNKNKEAGDAPQTSSSAANNDIPNSKAKVSSSSSSSKTSPHSQDKKDDSGQDQDQDQQVVELDDSTDLDTQLRTLQLSDERRAQIGKLRTKLLLRRAKGNQEQAGWGTLSAAEADYKELLEHAKYLPDRDLRFVKTQLLVLPPRVKEAQEREVGEMMGKLKDLGNSFLKPFGLSTDNFKMVKDEKTGGYSMNFEGGSGKK